MPVQLNLAAIPNQTFTAVIAGVSYSLRIFLASNVMCADLSINGTQVLTSVRLVAGSWLIPYRYLENGNFFISTLNDELPFYTQFNVTQFLIQYTQTELETLRSASS